MDAPPLTPDKPANRDPLRPEAPGLDALGHGIYLRPHQPHELKQVLFQRQRPRPHAFKVGGQVFDLPAGYEIDESPPMPANQFLNQVLIEESWDRFDKQLSFDAQLSVGLGAFCINSGASQSAQLHSAEAAYYALRSSFIPLWSSYLSADTQCTDEINEVDLPYPFSHRHRAAYEAFFERFGSHYVKRVWVGGKALLFVTVLKSENLTRQEIGAGLQASYCIAGDAEVSEHQAESRARLLASSQCCVSGRGGDDLKLAALSSLDHGLYNEWLATIGDNPKTIEFEVAGLWTLLKDPQRAQALREAYVEATTFTAISAAFSIDKVVYCVRGRSYFKIHIEKAETEKPKPLVERWPGLGPIGFDRIDAAFYGKDLLSQEGSSLSRKLFFFRRDEFVRIDIDTSEIDPGYPKSIPAGFPGVDFERLDAALSVGRDVIYFFSGNKYIRWNTRRGTADDGYPQLISERWLGVTFERIDAAIYWGNGKLYFFKEDRHIRYDMVTRRSDPGYPKFITGNYVEDWKFFD